MAHPHLTEEDRTQGPCHLTPTLTYLYPASFSTSLCAGAVLPPEAILTPGP